jgi:Tfp pilus assembly protein PilX
MMKALKKTLGNEKGFVLGTAILVSAVLILAGVFAIWMANTEMLLVRNESELIREFYSAEAGVVDAIENYKDAGVPTHWLTNDFLLDGDDATNIINYNDGEGNPVAMVEVRCILLEETPTDCSDAGDNLPLQAHRGPPPTGSGYSLKYFEVRRYGITSTSTNGNTQVQVGVYKVFNKQ